MKKIALTILSAALILGLVGCDDNDNVVYNARPAAPQGVFSITGDHAVYLYWYGPYESDIREYRIYRSLDPVNNYSKVGRRDADENGNLDLIIYEYIDNSANNGTTYYYAVTSVDGSGQESDLSAENVFDTPRPEGNDIVIDANIDASRSGFSLALDSVVAWDSPLADFWVDAYEDVFFLNKGRDFTDFQDMGWQDSFDNVTWAPTDGWVYGDYIELLPGHTYVIWTAESNYAKIHVNNLTSTLAEFTWGYQTVPDNPELVVPKAEPTPSATATSKQDYVAAKQRTNR